MLEVHLDHEHNLASLNSMLENALNELQIEKLKNQIPNDNKYENIEFELKEIKMVNEALKIENEKLFSELSKSEELQISQGSNIDEQDEVIRGLEEEIANLKDALKNISDRNESSLNPKSNGVNDASLNSNDFQSKILDLSNQILLILNDMATIAPVNGVQFARLR